LRHADSSFREMGLQPARHFGLWKWHGLANLACCNWSQPGCDGFLRQKWTEVPSIRHPFDDIARCDSVATK
jgi:hypothetical protein